MSSSIENPPASAPVEQSIAPKPGVFSRIVGVLAAPEETFNDIVRRPAWGAPLVLWIVLALIGGVLIAQKIDFRAAAREAIEQRGNVPADRVDSAIGVTSAMMKVFAYAAPAVTVVFFLLIAGVLLLAFRLMKAQGTFAQSFAVTLYAWTPNIIQSIVFNAIVVARNGDVDIVRPQTVVYSNLAFLVDPAAHPALFQLFGSLDLFRLWTLFLFVIGFAAMGRVSKGKSAAIIVTLWFLVVVLSALPAALR